MYGNHREELDILLDFGTLVSRERDVDKLLEIMADYAKDLLKADRSSIFIVDEEKDELWTKVAHKVEQIRVPIKKSIAGSAALSKEVQIIVDAYNDFRFNPDIDRRTGYVTKTIIAVPLLDRNKNAVGVFQVINKEDGFFTMEDANFLLLISNYAASAIENAQLTQQILDTQVKLIDKLASAAEFKDTDTSKHTQRVALYCAIIARGLNLPKEEINNLQLTAPMHDAGKIGIPDSILLKPGKLTKDEFDEMKNHSEIGYNLLKDTNPVLNQAAIIAWEHQEKFDGSGYPRGLAGEEININARITAVADVFDALTSVRPYKKAWSIEDALALLESERDSHFDPELVDVFLKNEGEVREVYERLKD